MQADTLRYQSSDDLADYWVGLDVDGNVCLIAFVDADDWAAGTSCASAEAFAASGTGVRLYTPDVATEVYLVPDGQTIPASLTELTPNIGTIDPMTSVDERGHLDQARLSGFSLGLFDEPLDVKVTDE